MCVRSRGWRHLHRDTVLSLKISYKFVKICQKHNKTLMKVFSPYNQQKYAKSQ